MKNWAPISGNYQPRWSPTFYDMDTALGIDNTGGQTVKPTVFDESIINTPNDKVAFLYGAAPNSFNTLFTVFSNKMWGGLDNKMFQNKYKPDYGSEEEYQVYSKMWSELRCSMITNVDDFIETFMSTQLHKCGEFLYNHDYDVKYITTAQIDFLHGTRLSFIKNWLKERITFLDSVFGYKTTTEATYLKDNQEKKTGPFIGPYNVSWKNEARISHNSAALKMPVITNSPVIMRTNIGNKSTTYTFVPKNTKTLIPVADSLSTPNIQTLINNSDCIIDMDMSSIDVINVEGKDGMAVVEPEKNTIYYSGRETIPELYYQYGSFSSLKKLNLKNAALDTSIDYFKLFKTWDSSPCGVSPEPFSLQELNLSGIKSSKVSAKLSGIDATDDMIPPIYKAPFKNVTSIDVSNSNISTVTVPTGVSLYNLNITNSNIQTLTLIDQPLLPAPNFNGCVNLTSISMIKCNRFSSLTFNSTTKALKTLNIQGCANLEILNISAGDVYDFLPLISIESCPKLRVINITGCNSEDISANPDKKLVLSDLPALERLVISGCRFDLIEWDGVYALNTETGDTQVWSNNLGSEWEKKGHVKLNHLNISSSRVSHIRSRHCDEVGGIDLRGFTSDTLSTLNCSNNPYITEVHLNNDIETPFYINTGGAFASCKALTRVYGYIVLNAENIFNSCNNFSIHGTSNVKYLNKSTYISGEWKHPMDIGILNDDVAVDENINISENKLGVKFQEGADKTNLVLNGSSVAGSFQNTSCTTFDVYYVLMNITSSVKNINSMFDGCSNVTWDWSESYSNDPHRYMFAKCGNVKYASSLFRYVGHCGGRLWSPKFDRAGNMTEIGILTPLKNLTSYICMFYPMSGLIVDRNICKLEGSDKYSWTSLQYFCPGMVVNDVNNINYRTYKDIDSNPVSESTLEEYGGISNMELHGNLSGFFNHLTNLSGNLFGAFNNVKYIDYSKFEESSLNIPKNITTLQGCLTSSYASGKLNLSNLFVPGGIEKLQNIYNSIRVSNIGGSQEAPIYLEVPIQESLFEECVDLRNIGYTTGTDFSGSPTSSAFSGAGLKKVLPKSNFPYDLLKNKTKLESFVAFFSGCDMTEAEYTSGKKLELPGSLFADTVNIRDISYCFYNIKTENPIELTTDSPFKNCPKLADVSYLFGVPEGSGEKSSIREGSIPLRFFYTGSTIEDKVISGTNYTEIVKDVTYRKGTTVKTAVTKTKNDVVTVEDNIKTTITYTREYNNFDEVEGDDTRIIVTPVTNMIDVVTTSRVITNDDGSTINETPKRTTAVYTNPKFMDNLKTYTVNDCETFNKSVSNLMGCFQGADFVEYTANYDNGPESNADYNPFTYVYNNGMWSKVSQNNVRYTFEWIYDGDRKRYMDHINSIKGSDVIEGTLYEYEHLLPDDAWVEEMSDNFDSMNETILTDCYKPIADNWGNIRNISWNGAGTTPTNFCTPPDLFRYCNPSPNIEYMFANCGMYSHNGSYPGREKLFGTGTTPTYNSYGLTGRLCPYLLKPLPNLLSLKGTFSACSWIGGYHKVKENATYIIPESFFKYLMSPSLDLTKTFNCWSYPAGTTLNVFHFKNDITMNVEEAFVRPFFLNTDFKGDKVCDPSDYAERIMWTEVNNVFTDPKVYVRGMRKCFLVRDSTNASASDPFRPNQAVTFTNVFDPARYDKSVSNSDYYVFCGYRFVDAGEELNGKKLNSRFKVKTVREDLERHNYDALGDPNKGI